LRAARPSVRVGRWRAPATAFVDGWPLLPRRQQRGSTEPGVSVNPSTQSRQRVGPHPGSCCVLAGDSVSGTVRVGGAGMLRTVPPGCTSASGCPVGWALPCTPGSQGDHFIHRLAFLSQTAYLRASPSGPPAYGPRRHADSGCRDCVDNNPASQATGITPGVSDFTGSGAREAPGPA
jgi:hypothetical protein